MIKTMTQFNTLREITSPLDQFEIRNLLSMEAPILGDINISITNIGLYLLISTFIIISGSVLATNYNKIISNS
jgi:F-type H+-transporting ATPase subunit a